MPNAKMTLKQLAAQIREDEERLAKDEGAWLKSLGELGDVARLLLRMQEKIDAQETRIAALERRLEDSEKSR